MRWSFSNVWNESVLQQPERPLSPRDHIWASELGGPLVDRFLKMKGVHPSNPFGARSLRKFDAGNIWEWIVGIVLKRSGLLIDNQEWLPYQYPGMLKVTGRFDFLAGGKPDWNKSRTQVNELGLPDFITKKAQALIDHFQDKYPNGLDQIILEIKSSATMSFERYAATNKPDAKHKLQAFHYLKAKQMPEAHIVYVCKDDARLLEFAVFNDPDIEAEYKKDIESLTYYVKKDERPPLEQPILFTDGKFRKNWKIGYSPYLTLLYGFNTTKDYDETFNKRIIQWNRVLARKVNGDKMTELNKQVLKDLEMQFPNLDDLVEEAKAHALETGLLASLTAEGGDN